MLNGFNIEAVRQIIGRRPVPVSNVVAKTGSGKGTQRQAAGPASAAAPAGGGGGAATVPIKPTLLDSCVDLLRALVSTVAKEEEDLPGLKGTLSALAGVFVGDKTRDDLSKRSLDTRLHEEGCRIQALQEVCFKTGRATAVVDLVGVKAALNLLAAKEDLPVAQREQAQAALKALAGKPLAALPDEARSVEGLKSLWGEISGNATKRAYEFLKRGRLETQFGLILLVYQLSLYERSIPKAGEGPRDPEKNKVTVPAELVAALDRAIVDMAGTAGGTNGGDAQKKTRGGAEIERLFATPLKNLHLQTSGKSIDSISPFSFESLLHTLSEGSFDPMLREAVRTVLTSFFAYREQEVRQYIEVALESKNVEAVEEGLKMLRLFSFALDNPETKQALFNRTAGLYLGTFVKEDTVSAEEFDGLLRARKAARTALLEMTSQELSLPHERETVPLLAEHLLALASSAAEKETVAAQTAKGGDLYVPETEPIELPDERPLTPEPKVWKEFLAPAIRKAGIDVLVELVNEKNLGPEERVEAQRALEKIMGSPYLRKMLDEGRGVSGKEVTLIGVGVVDRPDIREGEVLDAGELENGKRVFLSKNKGNAHAIMNGEKVLMVTMKMGKKKLRIGIRLNQGNGTRNNIASMAAGSKGAMMHGNDTLANGSSKSTAPNIAMMKYEGRGGIVEHPADNLVACTSEMKAAGTSTSLKKAMEDLNIHMALFGERAPSAGLPSKKRAYQAHLGQLVPNKDGTIAAGGFSEKPPEPVLDYRKRRVALNGFGFNNPELMRLLNETEAATKDIKEEKDRRKVEGASPLAKMPIGAFFRKVFMESTEIGLYSLTPQDKQGLADVVAATKGESIKSTDIPADQLAAISHLFENPTAEKLEFKPNLPREDVENSGVSAPVKERLLEAYDTKWQQFFVEAAQSPAQDEAAVEVKGEVAQKLASKGVYKKAINLAINIATNLRFTYLNTFNIYFSEEGLGLLRFYYGQAGSNGMPLTLLLGELDFSKRVPEAMMERSVERWGDGYPGKEKTGGGTKEDWVKQWYIAQCLFLVSGMPKEITDRIFANYQSEYPNVEDLHRELVETRTRLIEESKNKPEEERLCGCKIMIGAVDFFADVGTHLAYARSLQQALGANQTMRSLHRHWQGLLIGHNIEKGVRFGNLELAAPAFKLADEIYDPAKKDENGAVERETKIALADASGTRLDYPDTVKVSVYEYGAIATSDIEGELEAIKHLFITTEAAALTFKPGVTSSDIIQIAVTGSVKENLQKALSRQEEGKEIRVVTTKQVAIRADGSCNIGGVEIADIAHVYIGGKSRFKEGTKIGSHAILIAAEVLPPEKANISIPDYVMIEGAKINRKMRFFGETSKEKMIVLYDLWLTDDGTTFGVLPDTVVARQHLCRLGPKGRAVESHAVVPLALDTKTKGKGKDPVLGRFFLTETNMTAGQPLFGFPLSVKEFWDGLNPVRVDTRETMLANARPLVME
ncbi:MAG: hypothetical protein NT099_05645 [Candidatus Saganbacteria bacterium]|nr:hypothetical protein [Candidatus Saganbacteria bacterium]